MWIFFNVRVHSLRTDQMTLKETHIGLGIHQDYLLVYPIAFDQMWNSALQTIKNEKSKDYCKADSEQRVLFFHNNISAGRTSLLQVYRCSYRRHTILLYSRRSGMLQSHNKLQLPAALESLISSCLIYSSNLMTTMIYEAKITSTRRKLFLSPRLSRYWIWWRTLPELEQTNNQLSIECDSLLLTDSV